MTDNPYESPGTAPDMRKLTRFPAFLTGLIGLAVGAGFYGMLCGFLLIAYFTEAPGIPTPRERVFMIGAAVFHIIPLAVWVAQHRRLYHLGVRFLWILAITCWLLIPLSAAVMIVNLGM